MLISSGSQRVNNRFKYYFISIYIYIYIYIYYIKGCVIVKILVILVIF